MTPHALDLLASYVGTGNRTFAGACKSKVGLMPVGVAVGDLDGVGLADVAVSNATDATIGIEIDGSDNQLKTLATYPVSAAPSGIAIGDLDGDGRQDIVTAYHGADRISSLMDLAVAIETGAVSVFLGLGDGTFAAPSTCATGGEPAAVVIAGFSGDGIPDLAVANAADSTITVLAGTCAP